MRTTKLLPHKMICFLAFTVACCLPTHALRHTNQEKDRAAPQENTNTKKPDEKKPPLNVRGGIEILSNTMGVDFRPYLQRLKVVVQSHWQPLIPESAMPPMMKSGTVVIEFAIMKNGEVAGMKLVSSSGDWKLDRAAWGGISTSIPLPTLPSAFNGEYLLLRCTFLYNPEKPETQKAPEQNTQEQRK